MAQSGRYADLAGPGTAIVDVPAVTGPMRAFRPGRPPRDWWGAVC
ncbi:hypothetical protein [Streptomyces finlayi]|nr:hypothetical protein [Streptomyces finlayi]